VLINCVVYQQGQRLTDVDPERIGEFRGRPGCFVWVALRDAGAAELAQMQRIFGLHELAIEDVQHGNQRPKVEEYGSTLFTSMHLIEPGDDGVWQVGEVAVFTGVDFVLSLRNRSRHDFLGVRERCEREPERLQLGPGFVLYALMDAVVDRYFPLLEAIETELEAIEERIFDRGAGRANVQSLYALKQRVTLMRHAVAPLLEVVDKLHGGRVPPVCQAAQDYFRDVLDHLARINAAVDAVRETVGTAILVNLSVVTIEEGETTKRLAAWAAIFAVCTAMVGIWGMNFDHMPELRWTWGYPMALGLVASAALFLHWRFRRAGWL